MNLVFGRDRKSLRARTGRSVRVLPTEHRRDVLGSVSSCER